MRCGAWPAAPIGTEVSAFIYRSPGCAQRVPGKRRTARQSFGPWGMTRSTSWRDVMPRAAWVSDGSRPWTIRLSNPAQITRRAVAPHSCQQLL